MISCSIYGVVVIDGSLYSRFYGIVFFAGQNFCGTTIFHGLNFAASKISLSAK